MQVLPLEIHVLCLSWTGSHRMVLDRSSGWEGRVGFFDSFFRFDEGTRPRTMVKGVGLDTNGTYNHDAIFLFDTFPWEREPYIGGSNIKVRENDGIRHIICVAIATEKKTWCTFLPTTERHVVDETMEQYETTSDGKGRSNRCKRTRSSCWTG